MSRGEKVEEVFSKAGVLEKKYDWIKAAILYEQALGMVGKEDFLKKGEIQERIGFCFHRAAFQGKSREEFKERLQQSVKGYENAHEFYEKLTDKQKDARMFRFEAVTKYLDYLLTSDPTEKRRYLDECLELEKNVLTAFWDLRNMLEYGRTYNELPLIFWHRALLEWDRQVIKRIVEEGKRWGEKIVAVLSEQSDSYEIARAYLALATCLHLFGVVFVEDPEKQEQHRLKVVEHLRNAVEFSEGVGDAYLAGLSHLWFGASTGGEESMSHFEKVLEYGEKTRDNYLKAAGLNFLAYMTYWKSSATEDPDQRRKLSEEAMKFYDKAEHHNFIITFQNAWMPASGGLISPPGGYAEHYLNIAGEETDLEKKLEFLEKSEKAGIKALKVAEDSDIPVIIATMLHILSKTLEARANLELDFDKKRNLLEKSLKYRERNIEIMERLTPFDYWNMGVMHNYLAGIKVELGYLKPDFNSKRRLLEEAVLDKEKCLKLIAKTMTYYEKMGQIELFAALWWYQDTYWILLNGLYELTNNPEHLRKAIEISVKAIESASKLDMISRVAESYWKIAKTQDILGEHLEAAENFEHASKSYMRAAEKIPQLKDLYQDHASYMQAWNEIEKAKHHHAESHYGRAREHYEKAANLHKSTERWNYLGPNYLAWTRLEEAEDLSRREQTEEARDLFQQAAELFVEAEKSIQPKLEKIESKDEKESLVNLAKSVRVRARIKREYCLGRIALEEAKILDRQSRYMASSRKYGSAAEKFQKAFEATEDESDRQELKPIVSLCRAWQMMTRAEAEASPDLYKEASKLFEEAKNQSLDEKAKLLALGHSRFCKALEAGTRFEDVRDTSFHILATQHLESAASYYLRAGFKSASEYAEATQKILDAYLYMHNAKIETDPAKKARFYMMSEKVLQAAAGSYLKAKHPAKQEQVSRLLEKVRKERELALSLTEVLHAPLATSTTTTFTTPTPGEETPIGLEQFEHADIQANLILRVKEVRVGEDVSLEIELVNAGKAPALLIKVEELVPRDFEVKRIPEIYRVEGRYLNMKGRKLAPLKTEEIRLVLRPATKGTFILKPRIMYLDENGKYKSHEPEPVTITVKELGIKSWIRGEK